MAKKTKHWFKVQCKGFPPFSVFANNNGHALSIYRKIHNSPNYGSDNEGRAIGYSYGVVK